MKTRVLAVGVLGLCAVLTFALGGGCGGVVDDAANKQLQEKLGNTSITVFPAFVRDGEQKKYDAATAQAIADLFADRKLAAVTISAAEVPINSPWGMNESKMFRLSVADFRTYLAEHPIGTDYALIGRGGTVVGVHAYLLDAKGVCAYAIGLNSHHKPFNDVNPQTVDDCTKIVLNVLRDELKAGGSE
jgi:hypothetical protein